MTENLKDRTPLVIRVERRGAWYCATEWFDRDIEELWLDEPVQRHLDRNCKRVAADVQLAGGVEQRELFVRSDNPDIAYVLQPAEITSADEPDAIDYSRDLGLKTHFSALRESVENFDTLFPRKSRDFLATFVEPELSLSKAPKEGESERMSWRGIYDFGRALVVAPPGAGKTSLLRRLAIDQIERQAQAELPRVPVYIPVRRLADAALDLEVIASLIAEDAGDEAAASVVQLLDAGRALLLIDGLDETLDEHRTQLVATLNGLLKSVPSLRVIATSRPGAHLSSLATFTQLSVRPLNDAQLMHWVWLTEPSPDRWRNLVVHLHENQDIRDVARNPLALSLIADLFLNESTSPRERGILAEHLTNVLLEDWDRCRGVQRSPWPAGFSALRSILSHLAHRISEADRDTFDLDDYVRWRPTPRESRPPLEELDCLATRTGLVQKAAGGNRWEFSHRIWTDYYAAEYAVRAQPQTLETMQGILRAPRGGAIWLMMTSTALDAKPFIRLLLDDEQGVNTEHAAALLRMLSHTESLDDLASGCAEMVASAIVEALDEAYVEAPDGAKNWIRIRDASRRHEDISDLFSALHVVWREPIGRLTAARLKSRPASKYSTLVRWLDTPGIASRDSSGDRYECTLWVTPPPSPPRRGLRPEALLRRWKRG